MSIVTLKLDKEAAELIHGILNEAMHQRPWIERRDEIEEIQDMIATQFGWPTWDEIREDHVMGDVLDQQDE